MAVPAAHDPGNMIFNEQEISNPSQTKTPNTSPLLSLPREIRDHICAYLLRAGDLAILCTSKKLGHEAVERLNREGVCRMKIGFPNGGAGDSYFPQGWKSFQNFHFRIFYGRYSTLASYPYFQQLERFANLNEADLKNECLITVEYLACDPRAPIRNQAYRMRELLAGMAYLTTFKTIVVIFALVDCKTWHGTAQHVGEKYLVETWDILKGRLEPYLGSAKLIGDADGEDRRLVFHPQEFRSSLATKQKNCNE